MEFRKLLAYYRERSGLTKTGLGERLNVTPSYAMEIESGRKPAPTMDRCREIAKILSLSPSETQSLIDSAMEERLGDEALLWLTEREKKYSKAKEICTDEILEALEDPIAVKALLASHAGDKELKKIIQAVVDNMSHLNKEKRTEIRMILGDC